MEKVTNRLYKVEDADGKERLVRGVDAKEIEAVKSEVESEGSKPDLIAEADKILASQKKEAELRAADEFVEVSVEGVTTTPKTLLKSNEPDFPVDDALLRESQNNPVQYESDKQSGADEKSHTGFPKGFPGAAVFERNKIGYHQTLRMSRDELIGIDGIGTATADAILKLRQ